MKLKKICLALAIMLCSQGVSFAETNDLTQNDLKENTVYSTEVQPRGYYLMDGGCSITAKSSRVVVEGYTQAYEDVSSIYVTLTVYQEVESGIWEAVWTNCLSGSNTDSLGYPSTTIWVDSGYNYMVEAEHTVVHNGRTETNYSESGSVYVS